MRTMMLAGASILALTIPGWSQTNDGELLQKQSPGEHAAGRKAPASTEESTSIEPGGSVRDAVGDPPVEQLRPTAEAVSPWGEETPFPPQDVSDDNLETFADDDVPYPSAKPPARAGEEADSEAGDRDDRQASRPGADETTTSVSDNSDDVFEEGEQVPSDIERYQGENAWERNAVTQDGSLERSELSNPSQTDSGQLKSAERGSAGAWDGRGVGRSFDRGKLRPDIAAEENRSARQNSGSNVSDGDGDARLQIARMALESARELAPEVRFQSYRFEVEDRQRIIEIAGRDQENNRRVEVDVFPDGQVESVAHEVPLGSVPSSVRTLVERGLPGFRPTRALRSIGRGLDVQYEIDGYSAADRPVSVEVQPNTIEMKISIWEG